MIAKNYNLAWLNNFRLKIIRSSKCNKIQQLAIKIIRLSNCNKIQRLVIRLSNCNRILLLAIKIIRLSNCNKTYQLVRINKEVKGYRLNNVIIKNLQELVAHLKEQVII